MSPATPLPVFEARRVIRADRGGSSWPVLVETDDGPRFTKLRGAAQGTGALAAEVIVAALADALGLRVPARSLVLLSEDVVSEDRHEELADLLRASRGMNLGFAYLDGARPLDRDEIADLPLDDVAAIVWLDGLVMNPDRTARNPNLLSWHGSVWLVDHGASLGFQYGEPDAAQAARRPMRAREPHLLAHRVSDLEPWDRALAARISAEVVDAAVAAVPEAFLELAFARDTPGADAIRARRSEYRTFLRQRLEEPRPFVRHGELAPAPKRGRPPWLER